MCDIGHTCGEDTAGKRDEFFSVRREPASDASRLRRDLARILLRGPTIVVVMFSRLVARRIAANVNVRLSRCAELLRNGPETKQHEADDDE